MDFQEQIKPFFWVEQAGSVSLCLNVGKYKAGIFKARYEDGFEGNGYDWASLATVFLDEQAPQLIDDIEFDPEADMFCAYSDNREALQQFAISFKDACEDDELIADLFSRAELD